MTTSSDIYKIDRFLCTCGGRIVRAVETITLSSFLFAKNDSIKDENLQMVE